MSTLLGHLGGNFFSRYTSQEIANVLPRRIKRLLYVSSAIGLLLKTRELDSRVAERINRKLKLAYNASALLFPIYIGAIIWKSLRTNVIRLHRGNVMVCNIDVCTLCDMDCWRTGVFFAKNAPRWLVYGSADLMATDIHDVLVDLMPKDYPPADDDETKKAA